jgi:hypothetical protein
MKLGERKKDVTKTCLACGKVFSKVPKYTYKMFEKQKYCSNKCVGLKVSRGNKHALGYKHSEEAKKKISEAFLGHKHPRWKGGVEKFPTCLVCNVRLSSVKTVHCRKHAFELKRGANHPNWKNGVSKHVHNVSEPKYKEWRMSVFTRDGFKCKLCSTKNNLQAHHILRWADYPEFRYDINNGITLCRAHHPRMRAEEKRLEPTFRELVSVSKGHY